MSAHARPRPRPAAAVLALAVALLAVAAPLGAQATPREADSGWRAPRLLKWGLLATSVGLGLWAWNENRQADDAYDALRRQCDADQGACAVVDGRYADARAEALFDRANAGDRRARIGLLAGQATLLGSAAFFIVDLGHGGPPENIPYDPDARGRRARLALGVRLPLR